MTFFSPAAPCDSCSLFSSPCSQTPAPSRTASFSESRADEVAPAKKAKPAMPQGNPQQFQAPAPFPFLGPPGLAEVDGKLWFGLCCGRGAGAGNRTQGCAIGGFRGAPDAEGPGYAPVIPPPAVPTPHCLLCGVWALEGSLWRRWTGPQILLSGQQEPEAQSCRAAPRR